MRIDEHCVSHDRRQQLQINCQRYACLQAGQCSLIRTAGLPCWLLYAALVGSSLATKEGSLLLSSFQQTLQQHNILNYSEHVSHALTAANWPHKCPATYQTGYSYCRACMKLRLADRHCIPVHNLPYHICVLFSAGTHTHAMLLSTVAFHILHTTTIDCVLHADMHKASAK